MDIHAIRKKLENFCENCPRLREVGGFDYGYGAPDYVPEQTCPADLDPADDGCISKDEFTELCEAYDRALAKGNP